MIKTYERELWWICDVGVWGQGRSHTALAPGSRSTWTRESVHTSVLHVSFWKRRGRRGRVREREEPNLILLHHLSCYSVPARGQQGIQSLTLTLTLVAVGRRVFWCCLRGMFFLLWNHYKRRKKKIEIKNKKRRRGRRRTYTKFRFVEGDVGIDVNQSLHQRTTVQVNYGTTLNDGIIILLSPSSQLIIPLLSLSHKPFQQKHRHEKRDTNSHQWVKAQFFGTHVKELKSILSWLPISI